MIFKWRKLFFLLLFTFIELVFYWKISGLSLELRSNFEGYVMYD